MIFACQKIFGGKINRISGQFQFFSVQPDAQDFGLVDPDLFQLDDDEYVVVTADPVPADAVGRAEQAIAECPRAALSRKD